jgi:hypothetical protein
MITKQPAHQAISELVQRFEEQKDSYKKADYNETPARRDFIDPFFKLVVQPSPCYVLLFYPYRQVHCFICLTSIISMAYCNAYM